MNDIWTVDGVVSVQLPVDIVLVIVTIEQLASSLYLADFEIAKMVLRACIVR